MSVLSFFRVWLKSFFVLAFGLYALTGAFDLQKLWLIDGANLLFHEAGHMLFSVFGEMISFWGGTWMQLLMPLGIGIAFYREGKKYSASIMLIWLGENAFGISSYMKDAQTQILPLVGGEIHDWGYLFGKLGLLQHDQFIGDVVWVGGFLTVLIGMIMGLVLSGVKVHVKN